MARPRNLKLHELWRGRIHRQIQSGMTITQFCVREGLSVSLFHAWKRRLRLIDTLANSPAIPAASAPPAFLPVAIRVPEHMLGESLPIVADLPNGVRLRIPTVDARLACRVVRAVAAAKTSSGGSR
jgi:hypothetical protein